MVPFKSWELCTPSNLKTEILSVSALPTQSLLGWLFLWLPKIISLVFLLLMITRFLMTSLVTHSLCCYHLAFELIVVRCFSNLDEMSGNGIGVDWRMSWLGWLLSSTKPAYQCPTLPAWVREVHLRRQFFPMMPASCIECLDEMVIYVWVTRLLILLQ